MQIAFALIRSSYALVKVILAAGVAGLVCRLPKPAPRERAIDLQSRYASERSRVSRIGS